MTWLRGVLLVVVAVILIAAGILWWIFYTTPGARFVVSMVSRVSSISVTALSLDGSLARGLRLGGLSIALPEISVYAERVSLSWTPLALLEARIGIQTLTASDVQIRDRRPKTNEPIDFTWPRVTGIPLHVSAEIKTLVLENLSYARDGGEPVQIERVSGRINWMGGRLALHELILRMPEISLAGDVDAGFARPFLRSALTITLEQKEPVLDDVVRLKADLAGTARTGEVAGTMSASSTVKGVQVNLDASVALLAHAVNVRSLIIRPGQDAGTLEGQGEVSFLQTGTSFSLRIGIEHLRLAAFGLPPAVLSGSVYSSGTLDSYSGTLILENKAENWRAFHLSSTFRGSATAVRAEELEARWLGGSITGEAQVDWKDGIHGTATCQARGLDPELIAGTWQGNVNSNLDLQFARNAQGETRASIDARLLKSTFRGRPVTGVAKGGIDRGEVRISQLDLHGRGFDVTAAGVLSTGISFDADVRDISALVPGGQGGFTAKGLFRYDHSKTAVNVTVRGTNLTYENVKVASFQIAGKLDQAQNDMIDLQASGRGLTYGDTTLRQLALTTSGKILNHTIRLSVSAARSNGEAVLSGGYNNGTWSGTVRRLQGEDTVRGDWRLVSPVGISLSRKKLETQEFEIKGGGTGEALSGRVNLTLGPMEGSVNLRWQRLDLSRLNLLVPATVEEGRSQGTINLAWRRGDVSMLSADAAISGSFKYRDALFRISESRVKIDWTANGLLTSWNVRMGDGGYADGWVKSTAAPRFSLPETADATLAWRDLNLAILNPFVGRDITVRGLASGDAKGALLSRRRFAAQLALSVRNGAAAISSEGRETIVPLETLSVTADWKEDRLKGRLTTEGGQKAHLYADFALPVSSRLPLTLMKSERILIALQAGIADMALLGPFLPDTIRAPRGRMEVVFNGSGTWERPVFDGTLKIADGGLFLPKSGLRLSGMKISSRAGWSAGGLKASVESSINERGTLTASISSSEQPRMAIPNTGQTSAVWKNIDLTLLSALLPEGISSEGRTSGALEARLLSGSEITASIETSLQQARVGWVRGGQGAVRVSIRAARLRAAWKGESLDGEGLVDMEQYGKVSTSFSLPVPARLPPRALPSGPVQVSLTGQLREQGLVTSLLPGLVEETKGRVVFDVGVTGTWTQPRMTGTASLADASAYLPSAGIRIKNLSAALEFSDETIRVVSFRAESGPGSLTGTGQVRLADWKVTGYEGKLSGERFQAAYLPDMRLLVSPALTIEGVPTRLSIRGDVLVPQALIYGPPTADVVNESPDVVIMDAPPKRSKFPIQVIAVVKITLGDDVQVKMRGIDAKLSGSGTVRITGGEENITAEGQVTVVKGSYSAYGVNLTITRGQIILAGPPEQASLNILAVRNIENAALEKAPSQVSTEVVSPTAPLTTGVKTSESATAGETKTGTLIAGVQITGTVHKPVMDLYSRPALPDADVLSYIVFGKPLGGDAVQAGALMQAAGSLLSSGRSESLQDKLKKTLGLETLEIKPGQGGTESTMVSLGKYLAPGLYVSFGRSIFTGDYLFIVRYGLTKNWEVRTTTGGETGGDIYYKIEFD